MRQATSPKSTGATDGLDFCRDRPGRTGGASLTQQAYAALRTRIVTCELPPGSSITERELARSTPYGLTPIRRALARLDCDGLVVTVPAPATS
ncbi:GntR family transcriptional regulator [Geodermatophilus sp. FMUSA9-8]|uniref:GntR family transcriptional regulator n=1 Tax=Geodermatophilus sp. FMUSA9-8 TaxID=3120155 RepID=UPI003FA5ED75